MVFSCRRALVFLLVVECYALPLASSTAPSAVPTSGSAIPGTVVISAGNSNGSPSAPTIVQYGDTPKNAFNPSSNESGTNGESFTQTDPKSAEFAGFWRRSSSQSEEGELIPWVKNMTPVTSGPTSISNDEDEAPPEANFAGEWRRSPKQLSQRTPIADPHPPWAEDFQEIKHSNSDTGAGYDQPQPEPEQNVSYGGQPSPEVYADDVLEGIPSPLNTTWTKV